MKKSFYALQQSKRKNRVWSRLHGDLFSRPSREAAELRPSHLMAEAVEEHWFPTERCGDVVLLRAALAELEALPLVDGRVCFNQRHNNGVGRVHVNLGCRGAHGAKKQKQPCINLTKGDAVPDYQRAVEMLLALVKREHSGCLEAAENAKAAAASRSSQGMLCASPPASNLQHSSRPVACMSAAARARQSMPIHPLSQVAWSPLSRAICLCPSQN